MARTTAKRLDLKVAKKKDRTEIEHLRGEVRKLEAENRRLQKLVKESDRRIAEIDGLVSDAEDLRAEIDQHERLVEAKDACGNCSSLNINTITLPHKTIHMCRDCGDRKQTKK